MGRGEMSLLLYLHNRSSSTVAITATVGWNTKKLPRLHRTERETL